MTDIKSLRRIFRQAWKRETSSDQKNWSPDNPAWGQCAVTACAVQDMIGGEIVWAQAVLPGGKKISHYFNMKNGCEIDLTREQFPVGTRIPQGQPKESGYSSTREYILRFPATAERYKILTRNIAAYTLK